MTMLGFRAVIIDSACLYNDIVENVIQKILFHKCYPNIEFTI